MDRPTEPVGDARPVVPGVLGRLRGKFADRGRSFAGIDGDGPRVGTGSVDDRSVPRSRREVESGVSEIVVAVCPAFLELDELVRTVAYAG